MFFHFINTVNLIIYFECIVLGHILGSIFPKRNHYVLRLIGSSLVTRCGAEDTIKLS